MEITVFAKKRTTSEGKTFYTYLSKLTKKDGSDIMTAVKFREEAGKPKPEACPCNIIVEKNDCNLSVKHIISPETGEQIDSYSLWVSAWNPGSEYVDHSLDDIM